MDEILENRCPKNGMASHHHRKIFSKFFYEHAYCPNDTPVRSDYTVIAQTYTQQGFQTMMGV